MGVCKSNATRHLSEILYSACSTALVLIFTSTIWLGASPWAQAATYSLSFDGQDDFGVAPINQAFTKLTVQVWVKPESFSAKRETYAAWVRGVDQPSPPAGGYIKRADNRFVLYQSKFNWQNWGFQVCTETECTDVPSLTPLTDPNDWYCVVATYNAEIEDPDIPNIKLYLNLNGITTQVGEGRVEGPGIPNVGSVWFGRWVAAMIGQLGSVAIYEDALDDPTQIADLCDCGPPLEGLVGYWPFNEGSGQVIKDVPTLQNNGRLGDVALGDDAEPTWQSADYLVDSDGDGLADSCDNCPEAFNIDQENSDDDIYGDACDACAQVGNDGGTCEGISKELSDISGTLANVTFSWSTTDEPHPNPYGAAPECSVNTVIVCCRETCFDEGGRFLKENALTPRCQRLPGLTAGIDLNTGKIGGDFFNLNEAATNQGGTYSSTIDCDIAEIYGLEQLAGAGPIECVATYASNFPAEGQIFKGWATSSTFNLDGLLKVDINIKPTSWPNKIGLPGSGVVPVAIYGSADLDVATIDPLSITLRGNYSKQRIRDIEGCEDAIRSWYIADVGSPGSPQPDGSPGIPQQNEPDGYPDLWVQIEEDCCVLGENDVIGLIDGKTKPEVGNISITGYDAIIVDP